MAFRYLSRTHTAHHDCGMRSSPEHHKVHGVHSLRPLLIASLLFLTASAGAAIKPSNLRCEYLVNPLGIDMPHPRLSWELESHEDNQFQTAYEILVASNERKLRANLGDL